jgi:hypothetical protein
LRGLFRSGFLLALRQPAKLAKDPLDPATGRVMTSIEVPGVHSPQFNETAFRGLNFLGKLTNLFVECQQSSSAAHVRTTNTSRAHKM